jgi:hypothetical protein
MALRYISSMSTILLVFMLNWKTLDAAEGVVHDQIL